MTCPCFFGRMLHLRGLDTVRITKVKGHADEGMVLDGRVRELDRLLLDEAADFGRRRVSNSVIDARRNLSGVCGRWYPVILDLHRFFIAISQAVVNHDGRDGTAPGPLVWSAGAPRGVVWFMRFGTGHFCPGHLVLGIQNGLLCLLLLSVLRTLLIGPIPLVSTPFVVATRTDVDRRGAGYGVPPFVPKGGHRERRPKGPKTVTRTKVGPAEYYELSSDDGRPTGGERPAAFMLEPWPQGQVQRHAGIGYELVQALGALVLQMVEQLPDVHHFFATCLLVVAEQVIDVPKIILKNIPSRRSCREPQLAEQLVEVPTILTPSFLGMLQNVDTPVPQGGRGASGGLRGFLPRYFFRSCGTNRLHSSSAQQRLVKQIVFQQRLSIR